MSRPKQIRQKSSYFRGTGKFIPGSEARSEEVFDFPYIIDDETVDYIKQHGRIMFIIRGPPGTGKYTLSSMISEKYPGAVVCSADKYFSQAFAPQFRNPETLTKSHEFCARLVKEECRKGTHPIIVQNTHIRKKEMQPYIDFALMYGYTVIMAITLRKFKVDSETLARTNKKGLTKDYFEIRLQQWRECYPKYIGWFLCPVDAAFVLHNAKIALKSLVKIDAFCQASGISSEDDLVRKYEVNRKLLCVAAFCNFGSDKTLKSFYLCNIVQNAYGKCFQVLIQGFVVTNSSVLAVVAITEDMKSLIYHGSSQNNNDEIDELNNRFETVNVVDSSDFEKSAGTFDQNFTSSGKTACLQYWLDDEKLNINDMTFIPVAQDGKVVPCIKNVQSFARSLFSLSVDEKGNVINSKFIRLDANMDYMKLTDDAWLLKPETKIKLKSVFTASYY